MDDDESIMVAGCEQFSSYRGYAHSFEWAGSCADPAAQGPAGEPIPPATAVVAIDAISYVRQLCEHGCGCARLE